MSVGLGGGFGVHRLDCRLGGRHPCSGWLGRRRRRHGRSGGRDGRRRVRDGFGGGGRMREATLGRTLPLGPDEAPDGVQAGDPRDACHGRQADLVDG
ncbi:MAG TPA: hypothetical protein VNH13_11375, partial [Candidatus Acidoferrales bacterium]|nr:hypothetical protein [Candidatus Acidoferrales bacterium]